MPMFTYAPQWDTLRTFFDRMRRVLPSGYTGLAGIRLHRTGHPLTLELFGDRLPDKPLYPLALFKMRDGRLVETWDRLENDFDVPWVKSADSHRFRLNVMEFYHAEDLLEPRAEEILKNPVVDEETLRKSLVYHGALAGV